MDVDISGFIDANVRNKKALNNDKALSILIDMISEENETRSSASAMSNTTREVENDLRPEPRKKINIIYIRSSLMNGEETVNALERSKGINIIRFKKAIDFKQELLPKLFSLPMKTIEFSSNSEESREIKGRIIDAVADNKSLKSFSCNDNFDTEMLNRLTKSNSLTEVKTDFSIGQDMPPELKGKLKFNKLKPMVNKEIICEGKESVSKREMFMQNFANNVLGGTSDVMEKVVKFLHPVKFHNQAMRVNKSWTESIQRPQEEFASLSVTQENLSEEPGRGVKRTYQEAFHSQDSSSNDNKKSRAIS
jgi:hypothetical protein